MDPHLPVFLETTPSPGKIFCGCFEVFSPESYRREVVGDEALLHG